MYFCFNRLLSGKTITNLNDVIDATNVLRMKGCKTVVVSSSNISSNNSEIKCIGRNFLSKN